MLQACATSLGPTALPSLLISPASFLNSSVRLSFVRPVLHYSQKLLSSKVNKFNSTNSPILHTNRQFYRRPCASVSTTSGQTLKTGTEQTTWLHKLPSGLRLEVIEQKSTLKDEVSKGYPPLVFVHGSYHAAWCWAEYWLPFFSAQGFDCYALSLPGQGGSDRPEGPVAGTLQSFARDIGHFIRQNLDRPPVLIGHSFGGLTLQTYLADVDTEWRGSLNPDHGWEPPPLPALAGVVLVCSAPPTGNRELIKRFIMTRPIAAFKVTLSLAAKAFFYWKWLCRESFFSPDMPDEDVERYQALLKESSKMPLVDLRKMNDTLPIHPPPHAPPILVLGAANDFILDEVGLKETADFYGTSAVVVSGIAHDVMLDLAWERAANVVAKWLDDVSCTT